MTLDQLLTTRRQELIERWLRAAKLESTDVSRVELLDQMPAFIDEIARAVRPGVAPLPEGGSPNAEEHGTNRLRLGFDIGEVAREYGLLHVCILELSNARLAFDIVRRRPELEGVRSRILDCSAAAALGLAIAMQAANSHNGTIKVRDIPGKGCAFRIELPAGR